MTVKNYNLILFIFITWTWFPVIIVAQQQDEDSSFGEESEFTFDTDTPYRLLEWEEKINSPIVIPKKKPRRKVFYGIKTKKAFTSKGYGKNREVELFYVLKKDQHINGFVRDCYWYDFKRKALRKTPLSKFNPKSGALAHGPYKKMKGTQILEEGLFYRGTKHGRWLTYSHNNILQNKEKYYKGLTKESLVSYYDPNDHKKVKEVIPIEYGEKEGYYYLFHPNGRLAVVGEFHWDKKVGYWKEYYNNGKRKKIVTYPTHPFEEIHPYVKKEWEKNGKVVYQRMP